MTSSQVKSNPDKANHLLYRTYFKLMLEDILHKSGIDATKENKLELHEFHKKTLGYKTTSGLTQEEYKFFLFETVVWWAVEKGIFVRTKKDQPIDIQNMSFFAEVETKSGIKRVIDLL